MTDRSFTLEGANIPIHWDHVDFVLNCFAAGLKPKARARALALVHKRADAYDMYRDAPNVAPLRGKSRAERTADAAALRALVEYVAK